MPDAAEEPILQFLTGFLSERRLQRLEQVLQSRTRHLVVVLEDLANAHNASACLRSCDGFGVQEVHAIENRNTLEVSTKVATGAAQWLDLVRHQGRRDNTRECLRQLRGREYRIVATSPHPHATPLPDYDIRRKTALVFGNERDGLSEAALAEADELLKVPMYGFSESFNISVAVAVCVYQLTTTLRGLDVPWRLDEADRRMLRAQWIRRAVGARCVPHLEARFHEVSWDQP